MKYLLMVVLMITSAVAQADSLIIGGLSHHSSNGYRDGHKLKEWNEVNPLLAIERKNFFVGKMVNSYNEDTTFAGYHHTGDVFGAMVMASNKYELSPLPRIGSLAVGD